MQIRFKPVGGATFILSTGKLKIAVDPVLCEKGTVQDYAWFKSERLEAPVFTDDDFNDVDLWLITHSHADHLDDAGISCISREAAVICDRKSLKILYKNEISNCTPLSHHQIHELELKRYKIKIEAVPSIHGVSPLSAFLAGNVNGYYLQISQGKENLFIYLTSDTVYKKKIIRKMFGRKIDMLIPNMGAAMQGTWIMALTLNSDMLRKMIMKLDPSIVLPVHYGTFRHYKEPVDKIRELNNERIRIIPAGNNEDIIF